MNRPFMSNVKLEVARADLVYVAVIIDLYKNGVIAKEKAEEIVGFDISDDLPGSSFSAKYKALKEQKAKSAPKAAGKAAGKSAAKEEKLDGNDD